MNEKEKDIIEGYKQVIALLNEKRLKEAITQSEANLFSCSDWSVRNRLEEIKTSYGYMLQYMRQGVNDPQRSILYNKFIRNTWEVAECGMIALLDKVSGNLYHTIRNNRRETTHEEKLDSWLHSLETFPDDIAVCQLMPDNKDAIEKALKQHEEINQQLFHAVWCNNKWNTTEKDKFQQFITSTLLPINDLCLLVSAVTLSVLACFDASKIDWLLNAYNHTDVHVRQRALVGLLIAIHTHSERFALYPEINARLSILEEESNFGKEINHIYIQLLRSQETEKIDKKMREEIIPEMMKNVNLMRNMKYGVEESNMEENEQNPDWESALEKSGLGDKIREMNELQMEGSDVYMSSFSQLKNYPFFRELHNWFYPFDMLHSQVVKEYGLNPAKENAILPLLLKSGFFCNSDKYSLCFIMSQIPQSQRSMMLEQMTQQDINEIMNESNSSRLEAYALRPEVISNLYIHDLYRFYKLYFRHSEFHDIFQDEIKLHSHPILKGTLQKAEFLKSVGDFHFQKEHYTKAIELYQEAGKYLQEAELFQKIGFAYQKNKCYKEAIEAYLKADILTPDNLWTLKHLATCHRHNRNFKEALTYYKRVESIEPDNKNALFFIGICLLEEERHEEALQYFFKLDYLESEQLKVWRAIGWCSFVYGKFEQADKYYNKILTKNPIYSDYLNAAHVAWVTNQLDKAVEFYTQALKQCKSKNEFLEIFYKDKEELLKKGIKEEDIPLVLDMIL